MPAPVDLRSDTVTKPTPAMYQAMAEAELGDNVLERDPTVQKLEELACGLTGKEAAIFVPSGTMSNQAALAAHTRPGDSVLFEDQAHMVYYECGAPAVLAGVVCRGIPTEDGVVRPEQVRAAFMPRSIHTPGTSLLCLENTHNRHGGSLASPEQHEALWRTAQELGVPVHLDGARLCNAAAALGRPLSDFTQWTESTSICLSKGLGSPVGSILLGEAGFIETASHWRKRLGGGMRQAGILAACGIVSLTSMRDRLVEDHDRARRLAAACAEMPGLEPLPCPTNILIMKTQAPAEDWQAALHEEGVWAMPFGPHSLRAVFHYGIDDESLGRAIEGFRRAGKALASTMAAD